MFFPTRWNLFLMQTPHRHLSSPPSPPPLYVPLTRSKPVPFSLRIPPMVRGGDQRRPSASKVLAVITLLPVGGTLLLLSGLSFIGSMIGLAVATPLFLIFSPVLVPEAIGIGLYVTGVLTSCAFGMTALSSLSWLLNYLRQAADSLPKSLRVVTDKMGQKMKEMGHEMQKQAHDGGPIVRRFL